MCVIIIQGWLLLNTSRSLLYEVAYSFKFRQGVHSVHIWFSAEPCHNITELSLNHMQYKHTYYVYLTVGICNKKINSDLCETRRYSSHVTCGILYHVTITCNHIIDSIRRTYYLWQYCTTFNGKILLHITGPLSN